ncbi:hypothetical protein M1N58_02965 [Dehalococcoidales bacterium]|nr:hypothetical protein [Dehalococcoidales bacterium]
MVKRTSRVGLVFDLDFQRPQSRGASTRIHDERLEIRPESLRCVFKGFTGSIRGKTLGKDV